MVGKKVRERDNMAVRKLTRLILKLAVSTQVVEARLHGFVSWVREENSNLAQERKQKPL